MVVELERGLIDVAPEVGAKYVAKPPPHALLTVLIAEEMIVLFIVDLSSRAKP